MKSSPAESYAERDVQYDAQFTRAIELVLGEGFLCHGSGSVVEAEFQDLDLNGKSMLDFGCGLCGPAFLLAAKNDVAITAVDVEPFVIEESKKRLAQLHLKGSVEPQLIEAGQELNFQTATFDYIYASECILHIENKQDIFNEFHRILKPGGILIIHDWLHSSPDYSRELVQFMEADGLEFHLITELEYKDYLTEAKFKKFSYKDTSQDTLVQTNQIIEDLKEGLAETVKADYGEAYYSDYLSAWEQQAALFESGELKSASFRVYK